MLVVLVLVLVVVVLVSVLVEDGWGQHAAIPHPYLLTPQRPRDMPTGWYDCYERWYQAEAQPPPLIQLEHFVHCELCVGPKISTGRRKKGAFYAELWVPVAVAGIFNRIGPILAVKRMDNSTNSASMFKQAKSKKKKRKNNFRLKVWEVVDCWAAHLSTAWLRENSNKMHWLDFCIFSASVLIPML